MTAQPIYSFPIPIWSGFTKFLRLLTPFLVILAVLSLPFLAWAAVAELLGPRRFWVIFAVGDCGVKMGEKPIFGRFRGVFRGELGVAAGGAGRMERAV